MGKCRQCNKKISIEALICPACGAPDPFYIDKVNKYTGNVIIKDGESLLLIPFIGFVITWIILGGKYDFNGYLSFAISAIAWGGVGLFFYKNALDNFTQAEYFIGLGCELADDKSNWHTVCELRKKGSSSR